MALSSLRGKSRGLGDLIRLCVGEDAKRGYRVADKNESSLASPRATVAAISPGEFSFHLFDGLQQNSNTLLDLM